MHVNERVTSQTGRRKNGIVLKCRDRRLHFSLVPVGPVLHRFDRMLGCRRPRACEWSDHARRQNASSCEVLIDRRVQSRSYLFVARYICKKSRKSIGPLVDLESAPACFNTSADADFRIVCSRFIFCISIERRWAMGPPDWSTHCAGIIAVGSFRNRSLDLSCPVSQLPISAPPGHHSASLPRSKGVHLFFKWTLEIRRDRSEVQRDSWAAGCRVGWGWGAPSKLCLGGMSQRPTHQAVILSEVRRGGRSRRIRGCSSRL